MLRGFKTQNEQLANPEPSAQKEAPKEVAEKKTSPESNKEEERKESKNAKSPFNGKKDKQGAASPPKTFGEDEIEEDIIQDIEDIQLLPNSARDAIGTSGGAASSSAVGIDQSIDTLNMGEFDYIEEVKITPRK